MKKFFLILLALPIVLFSCTDSEDPATIEATLETTASTQFDKATITFTEITIGDNQTGYAVLDGKTNSIKDLDITKAATTILNGGKVTAGGGEKLAEIRLTDLDITVQKGTSTYKVVLPDTPNDVATVTTTVKEIEVNKVYAYYQN